MTEAERAQWLDLDQRYRFLYGMPLQERLAEMRQDIGDWWWVGGLSVPKVGAPAGPTRLLSGRAGPSHASVAAGEPRRSSPPPARLSLAEPKPIGEHPLDGLPSVVKRTIQEVCDATGVSPAEIMSRKTTRRCSNARRQCAKRLRALRFGVRGRPSQAQIAIWLRRNPSTICYTLRT